MGGLQRSSFTSYNSTRSFSEYGLHTEKVSDGRLLKYVNDLKDEIRILKLENEILEKAIMRLEPALMHGVYQALEYVTKLDKSSSTSGSTHRGQASRFTLADSLISGTSRMLTMPSRVSFRKSSGFRCGTFIYGSGRQINFMELTELVSIEMKIQEAKLKHSKEKAAKERVLLESQFEEIDTRINDTEKAQKMFKHEVLTDSVDKITQRISAESWIRFMRDWLKRTDNEIRKLRLRTTSFNTQYQKLKSLINVKAEIRENLTPVDFTKLEMQNSECMKIIDDKLKQLKEAKKMTADANLNLVFHKDDLMEKNSYLAKVLVTTKQKEIQTVELNEEYDSIKIQTNILSQKLDETRELRVAHEAPDVMKYVEMKWEITNLKKAIKSLEKRARICHIGLKSKHKDKSDVGKEQKNIEN